MRPEDKRMKYYIGVDIGGTKCAVVLAGVNKGIRLIEKIRFASEAEQGPGHMLTLLYGAVDRLVKGRKIEAIGISCGGPLDSRRGVVLCPPNLPGWVDIPAAELFQSRYGVPAFLMNDANACALAEWKLGAGRGTKDMIFLTMGTGMGAGVIAGGQLLIGASDMAGEIGHLRLSEDGPVGFGKAGSFEGFTSGGGIGRYAASETEKMLSVGHTPAWTAAGHPLSCISAKLIADYAHAGDTDAKRIYEDTGRMLGKGLALLVDAFNPEKIVIGSIFVRSGDLLIPAMDAELKKEAIPYSYGAVQVVPAETGENLGDYAAVMTALYNLGIDPMAEAGESDEKVLKYFNGLFEKYPHLSCVKESLMDAYLTIRDCYEKGGKLLLCGNGGSCADCEHIVGELMKGFWLKRPVTGGGVMDKLQGALPAIALTGHSALSSAFVNDCDPLYTYAQQTLGLGKPGDVLIGISTSGNSKNVSYAVEVAKAKDMKTIALTGGNGGKLREMCDIAIVAPGSCPADVQECHLPIYHALCGMLEAHFFG